MSNRALRRLMDSQGVDQADHDEDEELEDTQAKNRKKNMFDLLALEDLDIDDDNEENDDRSSETSSSVQQNVEENNDIGKIPNKIDEKKKQKKAKRKKKQREKENAGLDEGRGDQFDLDSYAMKVAEERRRMEECLEKNDGASAVCLGSERAVLSVDHRNLDADYEMSRIFGSNFVRNESTRRVAGRMPGAGLVRPKAQWPMASQIGLSMRKMDETGDGDEGMWFVVEHNKEYRSVNQKFHDALHSHDPNNLQEIFRRQPYHVDTLLQMGDVFRMEEDYDTAADLIERAVFSFTRSAHPLFNVSSGRCLLDYRYDENRGFFVALFLHIQFLGRRGCYRTGLEFCKVLLSLNPKKDPLAAILMIDHLCIMSGELEYLLRLFREWQSFKNLNQLPNFMFSCALARFRRRDKVKNGDDGSEMVQDALLRYPGWLNVMLNKCEVAPDDRVSKSQFFQQKDPEGLVHLYELHIGRVSHCWKEPLTMRWLEKNVTAVLDIVEANTDPRIKEYAEHRSRRYRETPTSVLRHIFLSSIPGVTFSMPSRMAPDSLAVYDPLPPKDAITTHPRTTRRRRAEMQSGFLVPFLNSMLPTYNPQEEGVENPQGSDGQRAQELLETIRQLLAGIQPNPPPVENGHDVEDIEEVD